MTKTSIIAAIALVGIIGFIVIGTMFGPHASKEEISMKIALSEQGNTPPATDGMSSEPAKVTPPTSRSWESYAKPSDAVLRAQLTPIQYTVTQEDGTEKPFANEYDANRAEGIYVDILSGEPLYSSRDKFDSGTGWPSFVKPITPGSVTLHEDRGLIFARTEIRSKYADSHLGHVFDDGPAERGGLRYCMNSAALRFVPKDQMEKQGYGDYLQYL